MKKRKPFRSGEIVATVFLILITGCKVPHYKMYDGPQRPSEQVSLISSTPPAWVEKIDGKGYFAKPSQSGESEFEVLPARHTFEIGYHILLPRARRYGTSTI